MEVNKRILIDVINMSSYVDHNKGDYAITFEDLREALTLSETLDMDEIKELKS